MSCFFEIMGDEMLSVFYSGDIFVGYGKISVWEVVNLKVSFDEKSEFCFFRDYFGFIRFVQNVELNGKGIVGIDSLYDFIYIKRFCVDSVGLDYFLMSLGFGGNLDIELCIEMLKVLGLFFVFGVLIRNVFKWNVENNSEVVNCNWKNCESKKNRNVNVCVFCRNNGESKKVYLSYVLKDVEGNIICLIFRVYICFLCKVFGDQLYIIKYCFKNKSFVKQLLQNILLI